MKLGMLAKLKTQAAAVKKKVQNNKELERFVREVQGMNEFKESLNKFRNDLMGVVTPLAPDGINNQVSYEIGRIAAEGLDQAVRNAYLSASDKLEEYPKLQCRNRVLEERLADSVSSSLQEMSSLRMRARGDAKASSAKTESSADFEKDMSFYEPLKYLDEAQRKLVITVAKDKVEQALEGDEKAAFLDKIAKAGQMAGKEKEELQKLREENVRAQRNIENLTKELQEERKESEAKILRLEALLKKVRKGKGGIDGEDFDDDSQPVSPQQSPRDVTDQAVQTDTGEKNMADLAKVAKELLAQGPAIDSSGLPSDYIEALKILEVTPVANPVAIDGALGDLKKIISPSGDKDKIAVEALRVSWLWLLNELKTIAAPQPTVSDDLQNKMKRLSIQLVDLQKEVEQRDGELEKAKARITERM